MHARAFFLIAIGSALGFACSSDDKGNGGPASGGVPGGGGAPATGSSTSSGGSSATGGGAPIATGGRGPAITMAPPNWAPPAECNGVGEKCQGLGCGGTAMCQADGDVCIPPIEPGMLLPGVSAERPYCLAWTCMTYDEASCFCTGEAGKQYPACKTGPAAVAGICSGEGTACGSTGAKACCDGLSCSMSGPSAGTCRKPCTVGTECDTGCCTDLKDNGQLVCAPESACTTPCKKRGAACEPNAGDCCNGSCVASENPLFAGCRPSCSKNEDCDTGCCQLFSNSATGFCADAQWCTGCQNDDECASKCCVMLSDLGRAQCIDAKYCVCGTEGTACGGDTDVLRCCEGTVCSRPSAATDPFKCTKTCKLDADCPSGCCTAFFEGKDYGACRPVGGCN